MKKIMIALIILFSFLFVSESVFAQQRLLRPGSTVGFQRPVYETDMKAWLERATKRTTKTTKARNGDITETEEEADYKPTANVHELARDIMKAQLSHISLDGANPANLAKAFYNMAQVMKAEGDKRNLAIVASTKQ